MYFTANGRALPCCIAPFSQRGYENYTLGDATQQTLREIWNGPGLPVVPRGAVVRPAAGGLRQLRPALEPLSHDRCDAADARFRRGAGRSWSSSRRSTRKHSIGEVVRSIPRELVGRVIVADGGSSDATVARAEAAGAEVIAAGRGYGRACLAATVAADDADILVFMDGDGADDPQAHRGAGRADPLRRATISSSARGRAASASPAASPGTSSPPAAWPGWACGSSTACATPTCARSGRSAAMRCSALGMREMTYGWNIEMQMRAARAGLRILEVPVDYHRRSGGISKVAGSLRGTAAGRHPHRRDFCARRDAAGAARSR